MGAIPITAQAIKFGYCLAYYTQLANKGGKLTLTRVVSQWILLSCYPSYKIAF